MALRRSGRTGSSHSLIGVGSWRDGDDGEMIHGLRGGRRRWWGGGRGRGWPET